MIRWQVKNQDEEFVRKVSAEYGFDPVIVRLLYNRGLTDKNSIKHFFDIDIKYLHDYKLLNDIEKAVKRIEQALENHEKITIYGDYDVDGITSVVVLYKYLLSRNADVDYYIPDRAEEGYGLNEGAVKTIKNNGTSLIVTVDTGTTAVNEALLAKESGLDIIVTDHHECKEILPDCAAVVNPKRSDSNYPFKELAGVGVVLKLVCALMRDTVKAFSLYGKYAAIGTIADIMPLTGENRIIVALGLNELKVKPPVGIKCLLDAAGGHKCDNINAGVITYQVSPRLNAAGRIGNPKVSVDLLMSSSREDAEVLSNMLCSENRERQQKEQQILNDVSEMLAGGEPEDNIIIFASEKWHQGVIGIVASRIVEKYHKPCILICFDGEQAKGSARSVKGVSIFDLLSHSCEYLDKFGGHEMAAGLTLKKANYDKFVKDITKNANDTITSDMLVPVIEAECELSRKNLSLNMIDKMNKFEPFGTGNPTPSFCVKNLKITDMLSVGAGKHVKLFLELDGSNIQAMYFGINMYEAGFTVGDIIDVICSLSVNHFNNKTTLFLNIRDVHLCESIIDDENYYSLIYEDYIKTGEFSEEIKVNRKEMVFLYKYLIRQENAQIFVYNPHSLARAIRLNLPEFNYCKLMLCLKIMEELNLADLKTGSLTEIRLKNKQSKVDLVKSDLWNKVGEHSDRI